MIFKKYIFLFPALLFFTISKSQEKYFYQVDLTKVNNDKVLVTLSLPKSGKLGKEFKFPSIIPGTYAIYDFGRFIHDFKAFNADGSPCQFVKKDINTYYFSAPDNLEKIQYWVEDSWDSPSKENIIFEPAGTNIEENSNFILNNHGFFGYFAGADQNPFEIEISKPIGFFPSTGLNNFTIGSEKDIFKIDNYHDLVDSPIMYSKPDTSNLLIGNTNVLVSVYSPNKIVNSGFIASTIKQILLAQKDYLGGNLPVDKYAFIIYLTDKATASGASGALEHSYSSFYVLPEMDTLFLAQTMRDVAAHEFFHIVTPLNIHAEEIGSFDFNDPKMSKHLWLYEGLTEYNAHHMQVKHGLIDLPYFLQVMRSKIEESKSQFNDTLPFTRLSKNVLLDYKDQYLNVYAKGALIGMCLDILLRNWSNGTYGTQNLMQDLSKKYGKKISFKDDELFNDIEKLTDSSIKKFLDNYVDGNKALPFEEIFDKVGINFIPSKSTSQISFGNISMDYNPESKRFILVELLEMNRFGKKMGFKSGDELITIQGKKMDLENYERIISEFVFGTKAGDWVEIVVARKNKKGIEKVKKLKAKAILENNFETNFLEENQNPSEKQLLIRKSWVGV